MSLEDLIAGDTTNFHDVVNADQDMCDEIGSLPSDTDQMVSAIIGIVSSHIAEVWCEPRVTVLANQYGLIQRSAYDINVDDENGTAWDFDKAEQRNKRVSQMLAQRPMFLVGSQMSTAFSILQGLDKAGVVPAELEMM